MRTVLGSVVVALLLAVPASADQQISASSGKKFANPQVTIAQGEKLTFKNGDSVIHDVTSNDSKDGAPLFASPLTDPGGESTVANTEYLTTGSYGFICSVHPDMTGTLTVSGEGTPVPRPGADGAGATLTAAKAGLGKVKDSHKLVVKLKGESGAKAVVKATARIKDRTVTLARTSTTLSSGDAQTVTLKLGDKGRSAVKKAKGKLVVTFKATVTGASGAVTATAKRTYK